jgi:hypothetical protein
MVHINVLGQAAAESSAANPKHVGHDVDSVYDEEEAIKTKETDFKHKQVCAFGGTWIYFYGYG